jgi:hypothetical protein
MMEENSEARNTELMPDYPSDPLMPGTADALFVIVAVIVAVIVTIGFVVTIWLVVRNAVKVAGSGHDPSTLQTDLALKILDSQVLAGAPSTESRLEEVDRLHAAGTISDAERSAARATILAGL